MRAPLDSSGGRGAFLERGQYLQTRGFKVFEQSAVTVVKLPADGSSGALPSGHHSDFGPSLHLDPLSKVVAGRDPYGLPFTLDVNFLRRAQHVDCSRHRCVYLRLHWALALIAP